MRQIIFALLLLTPLIPTIQAAGEVTIGTSGMREDEVYIADVLYIKNDGPITFRNCRFWVYSLLSIEGINITIENSEMTIGQSDIPGDGLEINVTNFSMHNSEVFTDAIVLHGQNIEISNSRFLGHRSIDLPQMSMYYNITDTVITHSYFNRVNQYGSMRDTVLDSNTYEDSILHMDFMDEVEISYSTFISDTKNDSILLRGTHASQVTISHNMFNVSASAIHLENKNSADYIIIENNEFIKGTPSNLPYTNFPQAINGRIEPINISKLILLEPDEGEFFWHWGDGDWIQGDVYTPDFAGNYMLSLMYVIAQKYIFVDTANCSIRLIVTPPIKEYPTFFDNPKNTMAVMVLMVAMLSVGVTSKKQRITRPEIKTAKP